MDINLRARALAKKALGKRVTEAVKSLLFFLRKKPKAAPPPQAFVPRCAPDPGRVRPREEFVRTGIAPPAVVIAEHGYAKVCGPRKKISVIYNYFDKESTVFESLDALAKQNWRRCSAEDIEIILVDDGTPGAAIAERLPEGVLYVWQKKVGYGICRAKNTGARLANGDYLVFLDPDILVSPGYFDAILEGFDRHGERAVQCGYVWDYHFVGCPDPRVEFGVWEVPNRPTSRFYQVAGGNMAMSRRLYHETPGFDEDLIYGGVEDLLFGYHLGQLPDTKVVFNDRMESWHIPHPPSMAHAEPGRSWQVVKSKWPEFYDSYIVQGLR